jgi:hypothetical protein
MVSEIFKQKWEELKANTGLINPIIKSVPSLNTLKDIEITVDSESDQGVCEISFYNLDTSVDEFDEVPVLKKELIRWMRSFCDVRIRLSAEIPVMKVTLTYFKDQGLPPMKEAVERAFKRSGNQIVRVYKCVGGPKDGRRVSDPDECMKAINVNRRMAVKQSARKNAGKIQKAKAKTQMVNIVSRNRLKKATKRLKKVLGRRVR